MREEYGYDNWSIDHTRLPPWLSDLSHVGFKFLVAPDILVKEMQVGQIEAEIQDKSWVEKVSPNNRQLIVMKGTNANYAC